MPAEPAGSFGLEAFTQDDRLRLFAFTNAEKAGACLWTLRAFERARANYVVLLHAGDVATLLTELAVDYDGQARISTMTAEELTPLLDQLHFWQLLDRSFDGARAATLAEYRNRHYVYQFTQAGYRAYRAVEDVLGARMDDATVSRLVLPELLADLEELAAANLEGNAELVYRKLNRLDSTLGEMADRAARRRLPPRPPGPSYPVRHHQPLGLPRRGVRLRRRPDGAPRPERFRQDQGAGSVVPLRVRRPH